MPLAESICFTNEVNESTGLIIGKTMVWTLILNSKLGVAC